MAASGLSAADMAVYIINCIYEMQNTLALYEFTDNRLEMLSAQVCIERDWCCTFDVYMNL